MVSESEFWQHRMDQGRLKFLRAPDPYIPEWVRYTQFRQDWAAWDKLTEELIRASASNELAEEYRAIRCHPISGVPSDVMALANQTNLASAKIEWVEQNMVSRTRAREILRGIRS